MLSRDFGDMDGWPMLDVPSARVIPKSFQVGPISRFYRNRFPFRTTSTSACHGRTFHRASLRYVREEVKMWWLVIITVV